MYDKVLEAKKRTIERRDTVHFRSRFKHLNCHNGFRPGELHTLIGEKGGGKSSFIRAWVLELLVQHKHVYIRLSEEYSQDYRDHILSFLNEETAFFAKYLTVDSELELPQREMQSDYVGLLDMKIKAAKADVFIFDNFTTSVLSSRSPTEQQLSAVALRNMAGKNNIPVIVAAHTEKKFKKGEMTTGDNIRGNATLVNTASYIYTLTIWHDKPGKPTVVYIDKARHHPMANKARFLLEFDIAVGAYKADKPCTRELLEEILTGRRT
jgi:archaellum biogenesis ATPase FlaH